MYVIEHRKQDGEIAYWELSKAVPRDSNGEPVELGDLGVEGSFERRVVTEVDALDVLTNFLKGRVAQGIRVAEVERAMKATRSGGPRVERRIKPRQAAASAQPGVDYGRSGSGTMSSTSGGSSKTSKFPLAWVMVVLLVLAAIGWFFMR